MRMISKVNYIHTNNEVKFVSSIYQYSYMLSFFSKCIPQFYFTSFKVPESRMSSNAEGEHMDNDLQKIQATCCMIQH